MAFLRKDEEKGSMVQQASYATRHGVVNKTLSLQVLGFPLLLSQLSWHGKV